MNSFFEKPLEKLFALGEAGFDKLSGIGNLHAEVVKKLGAAQADLAEATFAFGGKQLEVLGKLAEPSEFFEAGTAASNELRGRVDVYASTVRSAGEELYSGYSKLFGRAFAKAETA